jgi:hypothetical protein
MIGYSTDKALSEELWQTAKDTIDTREVEAAFSNSLRGWIAIGVQQMIRQNRVAPPDVTLAHANLIKFIGLLKKEAMYLGHPLRLDSNTLTATKKRLRLRLLLSFGLCGRTISWFIRVENGECDRDILRLADRRIRSLPRAESPTVLVVPEKLYNEPGNYNSIAQHLPAEKGGF